jgi:hypothetical protein
MFEPSAVLPSYAFFRWDFPPPPVACFAPAFVCLLSWGRDKASNVCYYITICLRLRQTTPTPGLASLGASYAFFLGAEAKALDRSEPRWFWWAGPRRGRHTKARTKWLMSVSLSTSTPIADALSFVFLPLITVVEVVSLGYSSITVWT